MKENMYQFIIKGIALDDESQMPIIILQSLKTSKIIPLWIGPFEASAIIIEIEKVKPPRPLTHDLLSEFFLKHHYKLKYIYIYDFITDSHIAKIVYKKGFKTFSIEIRPSDGIALALRLKAPIYASEKVAAAAYTDPELLKSAGDYQSEILYFNHENIDSQIM
ncbi:MAG: bifunctional nuclease family protein [Spirochaetia bacterium]|jgi:bifunctional DNase/RNase|nr:bifunctional nuclease family protein [Spirochaetia bacterium]